MSYRMSRLAGAPPDADWLAALQNYERVKAFIEALHRFVSAVGEERRRPAPPPSAPQPAAAQPASPVKPAPPASGEKTQQQVRTKGETRRESKREKKKALSPQVEALRQMMESELASGRIPPERAPAYRRTLDKIESISQAHARGDLKADAAWAQTQELVADIMRYVAQPGTASARATPRGREVLRHAGALKAAIAREFKNSRPPSTAEAAGAVVGDVTKAQDEAARATDEAALADIEAESLRPAARAWHELMMTRHAVLARPLWECNEVVRSVSLAAAGPWRCGRLVSTIAAWMPPASGTVSPARFFPSYMRRAPKVTEVLPILYLRGLSTGDFQSALPVLLGEEATGLSPTTITRLTARWEAEYHAWRRRDLHDVDYVYACPPRSSRTPRHRTSSFPACSRRLRTPGRGYTHLHPRTGTQSGLVNAAAPLSDESFESLSLH